MKTLRLTSIFTLLMVLALLAGCSQEGPVALDTQDNLRAEAIDQKGDSEAIVGDQKGNRSHSIHMEINNTIEILPPGDDPNILYAAFGGGGHSRPFGKFDLSSYSEIDFSTYPLGQVTDYVFTFRNGDELHAHSVGTAIEDPPGFPIFDGDIWFTGGTGRFSNTTGSGTYSGTADSAAGVGQFDIDGNISGFGGNRHSQ